MTEGVGSISGQIRISVGSALAAYASVRRANATTRTALMSSSAAFAKVGVVALAAAAPIALLFKKAITGAADFQKKIDYFGAVTGASKADMQAVADKAISMSRTTVFSASQMADAFVEFGKAGIATKDIMGGVAEATANLAQAADISMGDAANVMASQLATFNLGAGQAAHVADQLAGAANASIVDVSDLATSLKYVGGIAASTKIPFDSVITALSLLGERGIKGSTAGTSLRQILVSLTAPTGKAQKALDKLGITAKDGSNEFITAGGNLKSLSEVFQILQNQEKGYTNAEKLNMNKLLFNSRALAAVQILMGDGATGFAKMSAQINKVTASDVAHKRLDNLAGDWQHLKNSIDTLLIQVGGPLQNFFRQIVQGLTKMVLWFGSLSSTQQKMIIYGLGLVGAFLVILGTLSLMIALVLKTVAVYRDLRAAFILIRATTLAFSSAFRAMAVSLLTNPIFLVIAALALLTIGFIYCWKHFKGFRDFFKKAWEDIKGFFIGAWNVIKSIFNFEVGIAKWAGEAYMKYWVRPVIRAVKAVISGFVTAYHAVSDAISATISFIKKWWRTILVIILGPLGILIVAIVNYWTSIKNGIVTVVKAIASFLSVIWNGIVDTTMAIFNTLKSFFVGVFNFYKSIIVSAINVIRTVVTAAWHAISAATMLVWNGIKWFFTTLWNGIKNIFLIQVRAIATALRAIWNVIGGPLKAFWNGISAFFTRVWRGITRIFTAAWNGIAGFVSGAWQRIYGAVSAGVEAVMRPIMGLAKRAYAAASAAWTSIVNAFSAAYDVMVSIGKNIIYGIWNGISGLATWLWNKVKGWLSNLWDGITGFLHISSPSKKAEDEIGKNIVLGIVKGLNKNTPAGVRAAVNLARAIHDTLKNQANETTKYVTAAMKNLASQIASSMQKAKDKLNALKDSYNQEKSNVASGITSGAGFSGLGAGTDAQGNATKVTLANIMAQYQAAATKAATFARQLAKLKKEGLNKNLIQELAEAGPNSSGDQVAQLASASSAQIAQINKTQGQLQSAANSAGATTASAMYAAGIQAAQGLVKGIQTQQNALLKVARAMGSSIVDAVKKELKIKSPSQVMRDEVGAMMARGVAVGITNNQHHAVNAVRRMSDAMVNAHTGQLNTAISSNMSGLLASMGAQRKYANGLQANQKAGMGFNVEKLEINNPRAERASDSLPRTIRSISYVTSGPAR